MITVETRLTSTDTTFPVYNVVYDVYGSEYDLM